MAKIEMVELNPMEEARIYYFQKGLSLWLV